MHTRFPSPGRAAPHRDLERSTELFSSDSAFASSWRKLDQMKKRAERALNKAPISFSEVEPSSAS